jgi:hypothetical protein
VVSVRRVRVLPYAITQVDAQHACVGSLTADGEWLRPEPVSMDMVESRFAYGAWTELDLGPSAHGDARPEDRSMRSDPAIVDRASPGAVHALARAKVDPDVVTALGGERSLGLVRATVERVYVKRSTGGRRFVRMAFTDGAGRAYDWIVPDLAFRRAIEGHVKGDELDPAEGARVAHGLNTQVTYLCLGLTKPNHKFPGQFRGCHPLVVGVHSFAAPGREVTA